MAVPRSDGPEEYPPTDAPSTDAPAAGVPAGAPAETAGRADRDDGDDGGPGVEEGALCGEMIARLGKVEEQLAEFHRRAAHRETIIDRLHEENQRLLGGVGRAVLEPVVADLIRLYDQLEREARRLGSDGPLLRSFADDVALVLDRCGLEIFSAEPGDPFEHDRHRPLAVVSTDDQARHNTVAEAVAAGFVERETGRVRRPVQARFYRYTPALDEPSPDEPGPDHDRPPSQ